MALLLLLLLALPVVELIVLVQVASAIGVLDTVGLVIIFSLVGVWLAKRAGLGVVDRIRRAQAAGKAPNRELTDGALVLVAGGLLVFPGFVSDALGMALLLPPIRAAVRTVVLHQMRRRGSIVVVGGRRTTTAAGTTIDEVWDVESWEDPPGGPARPDGPGEGPGEIEGGRA